MPSLDSWQALHISHTLKELCGIPFETLYHSPEGLLLPQDAPATYTQEVHTH